MLPATPCGRCFATTCGAHHSTSRWPDRPHQPSHLLPGIQHIYTRSRSPVQGVTVCTSPTSSAHAWPTCWWIEPQNRAASCVRWGRGYSLYCSRGSGWVPVRPCLEAQFHDPSGATSAPSRELSPPKRSQVTCMRKKTKHVTP